MAGAAFRVVHGSNTAFASQGATVRNEEKSATADRSDFYLIDAESIEARRVSAELFDEVLRAHGVSSTTVAKWWDCSETIVRGIRSGAKPLTIEKILKLRADVAAAYLDALKDVVSRQEESREDSVGERMASVTIALGELTAVVRSGDRDEVKKSALRFAAAAMRLVAVVTKGVARK